MAGKDWNPEQYGKFFDVRLQPALDLLTAVGDLPDGAVMDLGCGAGVVGPALANRYPGQHLLGLDTSPNMLARAEKTGCYHDLMQADVSEWRPTETLALIFSNAVLQWVPDHPTVLPQLTRYLAPGGVLAVQIPHQQDRPSGLAWRESFQTLFGSLPAGKTSEILSVEDYFDLLSPLGDQRMWETEYIQHLDASEDGHPVRLYTESTFGRPYLNALDEGDRAALIAEYETRMHAAYPLRADGTCLFPFRRLFFTLRVT